MRQVAHRWGSSGGAMCGAKAEEGRTLLMCGSGIPQFVTCPKCTELSRQPTREEALAALRAAAERFRAKKEK